MHAGRSVSPSPSTLDLQDVRKANAVRERLTLMLHTCDSVTQFREGVVELLCDMTQANGLQPTPEEMCAETLRSIPDFAADSAPATDAASERGLEFGP
jgi:tRNA U34 2-thiouridine synthase MnmA/TrmU